ncbi:MAG: transglycosylase domain-containing protein [Anaerolineaceae bacterium]
MKYPDSSRDSGYFSHSENPDRVIRRHLLLKRQAVHRGRNKRIAKINGLSGIVLGIISGGLVVILMVAGFVIGQILDDLPDIHQLPVMAGQGGSLYSPTVYFDRTGQHLITGTQSPSPKREYIPISSTGSDPNPALLSSYSEALLEQRSRNGESGANTLSFRLQPITIAERLVTDLLLSSESSSFFRAARMKILASQATVGYGRQTLLEWYLNTAAYGHSAYGCDQASQIYFNKAISQLNPGEVLILAVALQDPSINPLDSPDSFDYSLQAASSYLLAERLVNLEILDQASRAIAALEPRDDIPPEDNPAFNHYVREQLSAVIGRVAVERGGLTITTTMDYELQMRLDCAVTLMLDTEPKKQGCDQVLAGSTTTIQSIDGAAGLRLNFVVLDPLNGQVLAMLGDTSPDTGQQGYLQAHPSGSLLTPFIYLEGMLHGMGPATLVWDTPTNLDGTLADQYYDTHKYLGPMRMRIALAEDHLAPATKALANQGEENVVALMSGFGLHLYTTEGIPYESGITDSLSIAQAFGVFANGGNKVGQLTSVKAGILSPTTVLTAKNSGSNLLVDWEIPQQQAVISPALAFMMNDMLSSRNTENIRGSTKQGTTIEGLDFLRVVYNPDYVFALWVGYSDTAGERPLQELGIDTTLNSIVEEYYRDHSQFENWQPPADVVKVKVCDPSGKLPGDACPRTVMEYFLAGNEPTEIDTLYKQYTIDSETGRLATVFTDPTRIKQRVFFNPPPEEIAWARQAGYSLSPDSYAVFQIGNTAGNISIDTPQDFDSVRGVLDIKGALSLEGFISYRIDLGSGLAPAQWLQVGDAQTESPSNGMLGSLDTSRYQNGLYTLRIQVIQEGNIVDNAYAVILIDNPT